jgi:MFS family permease
MTAALRALDGRTFRSLHRHRNYRLFFSGQIVSVSGTWMQNIALAWLVIDVSHHSPMAVGALAFCRFVPFTVLGLVAGVVADRFDNRRLVIVTQTTSMLLSALLAALALSGSATLPVVYALAVLLGTAQVFDAPGRQALTYQLVGRDELPNAIALNSSLFNMSRVVGPALAGVVIAAAGSGVCFILNAISFLAVLAGLLAMRTDELYPVERGERPTVVRGTFEGLRWVLRSHDVTLVLLIVTAMSVVGFNFNVILPLLASSTLHAGPRAFGLLSACFGTGALAGALVSATLGRASWRALILGLCGFSVAMLALAPLRAVWACSLLLFLLGGSFTLLTANANALVQLGVPGHLRGRIVGLYLFAFAGLAPVGGLVAGWLVATGGTALAFGVAGATGLAVAAYAVGDRERIKTALANTLRA